jgi:hypothetical protein
MTVYKMKDFTILFLICKMLFVCKCLGFMICNCVCLQYKLHSDRLVSSYIVSLTVEKLHEVTETCYLKVVCFTYCI